MCIPSHLVFFLDEHTTLPLSSPLLPSPPLPSPLLSSPPLPSSSLYPQSEDKKFVPVSAVGGPLLALTHIIRQDYFPRGMEDILIHFLQKSAHERLSPDSHHLCWLSG